MKRNDKRRSGESVRVCKCGKCGTEVASLRVCPSCGHDTTTEPKARADYKLAPATVSNQL